MITLYKFIEVILWFFGLLSGCVGVVGLLTMFTSEWYISIVLVLVGVCGFYGCFLLYEKINTKRVLLELEQLEGHL